MAASSDRKMIGARFSTPAVELWGRLADALGLPTTYTWEFVLRRAARGNVDVPGPDFYRWHDNAGLADQSITRRLSEDGRDILDRIAKEWRLSKGDLLEYLIYFHAKREGII